MIIINNKDTNNKDNLGGTHIWSSIEHVCLQLHQLQLIQIKSIHLLRRLTTGTLGCITLNTLKM